MNKYIEEFKAGLKMYPNSGDVLESRESLDFFLRHAHQVASDDQDYGNFINAFPNFFYYIEVEDEFYNYLEEVNK